MLLGFFRKLFTSPKPKDQILSVNHNDNLHDERFVYNATESITTSQPSSIDYLALATSFNDLLLEAQHDKNQPPNPSESFIITELETMLQGEIPDSAVPRLPDVAMALLKKLADSNITSESIMSYINRDPALASDVLNLSNSPIFRGNSIEKIINLDKALIILGLNNLKTIVTSALMKRLMVIAPVYFRMFGQHLWQHSLDCGQACMALAKNYGQCDPNNAYLVGLMHDVGKLAIFGLLTKALGRHLDFTPRGSVFSAIVRDHSQTLSVKIAIKWGLPDYLLMALSEQDNAGSLANSSIYGLILNQANILAEFKAVAEKGVKTGQSFESLLEQYCIPSNLFNDAFPTEYAALMNANTAIQS